MAKTQEVLSDLNDQDRELVELLRELIQIPSWVPDDAELRKLQNENEVVDFLEAWLMEHTDFEVVRQPLEGGRFNLVVRKGKPDLVFLAHTDTVIPSENAPYGATDMKSGVATMIQSLSLVPNLDNVWMFLYADEEYDFLGMKALVEEYGDIRPKLIVSSDGSDLQIGNGCRGLIEIRAQVFGETGHPAKGTGNSAIWGGFEVLTRLKTYLEESEHEVMGNNSFSLAYMLGGAEEANSRDERDFLIRVGQAGNVVPDVMEFVLDIRPAFPDLDLEKIVEFLEAEFAESGLGFEVVTRKHDLGAWFTPAEQLREYENLAASLVDDREIFQDPRDSGYLDLQMFWDAVGRPPAFMYGGGYGETAHTPQERIHIDDLITERNFFMAVLAAHMSKMED